MKEAGLLLAACCMTLLLFSCTASPAPDVSWHFILYGGSGSLLIAGSTDGNNWSTVTVPDAGNEITCAAVSDEGHWVAASTGIVVVSDDGRSWAPSSNHPAADYLMGIAYDGVSRWVLVGGAWAEPKNMISYSDDGGDTWTTAASSNTTVKEWLRSVAFGAGTWVGVGMNTTFVYSADGDTWSAGSAVGLTMSSLESVEYDGSGLWVAVGSGDRIARSADGVSWEAADSVAGSSNLIDVCYGGGTWVAVGSAGSILTSTDGDTWELAADSGSIAGELYGVAFRDGRWVAVSYEGDILYSDDGDSWTAAADSGVLSDIYGVSATP